MDGAQTQQNHGKEAGTYRNCWLGVVTAVSNFVKEAHDGLPSPLRCVVTRLIFTSTIQDYPD